jgi:hypothetical protein
LSTVQADKEIQAVRLVVQVTTRFAVEEFFSYESFHARKKKNRLPTSYIQEEYKIRRRVFFVLRVAQFRKAKDFFCRRATYKGKYGKAKEAVSPPGAGLSPQKGDVRKSRKEQRARRWLQRRQGSVCPKPRICFMVHEYLGLEAARLG